MGIEKPDQWKTSKKKLENFLQDSKEGIKQEVITKDKINSVAWKNAEESTNNELAGLVAQVEERHLEKTDTGIAGELGQLADMEKNVDDFLEDLIAKTGDSIRWEGLRNIS